MMTMTFHKHSFSRRLTRPFTRLHVVAWLQVAVQGSSSSGPNSVDQASNDSSNCSNVQAKGLDDDQRLLCLQVG